MIKNRVRVSPDRQRLFVYRRNNDVESCSEYTSESPGGFTDAQIEYAKTLKMKEMREPGQKNRVWKINAPFNKAVFFHINTGPPTFRIPKLEIKWNKFMVGWLRILFAVKIKKR